MIKKLRAYEEKYNLSLIVILLIALTIRLYKLNFQSLWSDEVFSLMVSDPANSLSDIIGLCRLDVHPPFYQLFVYFWFRITSFSPFALRILSVIFGTAGVMAVYFLSKEIYDKYAGFASGMIASVVYFHIRYSQEGRSYALVFLLATLSFLFFIKIFKNSDSIFNTVCYGIFSLILIYTHYFGFVILISQMIIGFVWILISKNNKKRLTLDFVGLGIAVFLFYLPWLPVLLEKLKLKGVPIDKVKPDFIFQYFNWYFKWDFLVVLAFLLIFVAIFGQKKLKNKNISGVVVVLSWLMLSLFIPYLRSLSVPILTPRYTIISLPAIFVLCGVGMSMFKNKIVYTVLLFIFVLSSSYAVFYKTSYFSSVKKEQWREGIHFIENNNNDNSPVLGNWDLMFNSYSKALGLKTRFSPIYMPNFRNLLNQHIKTGKKISFWLMKGHFDDRIDWEVVKFLKDNFDKKEEVHLAYTHVEHYVGREDLNTKIQGTQMHKEGEKVFTAKNAKAAEVGKEERKFNAETQRRDAEGDDKRLGSISADCTTSITAKATEGTKVEKEALSVKSSLPEHRTQNTENSAQEAHHCASLEAQVFPDVFELRSNDEIQFEIVVKSGFEIGEEFFLEKRLLDKNKKPIESWSVKFGNYFLEPLASYGFSKVYFSEKIKDKYILKGCVEPYSAFLNLTPNKYFIEFRIIDKSKEVLKSIQVPIFLKENNLEDLSVEEKFLLTNNFQSNVLIVSDKIYKSKLSEKGIFNSYDFDLCDFLNFVETKPLVNYLKKKNYKYLLVVNGSKFEKHFLKFKEMLKLENKNQFCKLYRFVFENNKIYDENFNLSYQWNIENNDPINFYFNKKPKGKGLLTMVDDSVLVCATAKNSCLMFSFSKDKLWNDNGGYISVETGNYCVEIEGESLLSDVFVYPVVIMYNESGKKVNSVYALPLKIKQKKFDYSLEFKKEFTPFFTRSVKEKKPIAKGFDLPYFRSNLLSIDEAVKTISVGLYFYKDNGTLEISKLNVKKLIKVDN